MDSTGDTIDFLLSEKRDAGSCQALLSKGITDIKPSSPTSHQRRREFRLSEGYHELKRIRELGQRCRCRPVRYLNNVVEQDHRTIKRRVRAMQGFRAFHSAWRTIQGIETVNMIRKGQVRWLRKADIFGQAAFIARLFGVAIAA